MQDTVFVNMLKRWQTFCNTHSEWPAGGWNTHLSYLSQKRVNTQALRYYCKHNEILTKNIFRAVFPD